MNSRVTIAAAAVLLAAACPATPSRAQDAYVIGLTGALTGPAASTQAPTIEGLRVYVERLNARGGVNGHPVKLLIQDDQGEPSKAAANGTKLLTQDNVVLLIESSLSSTFAPVVAEAKRVGVPLLFAGAVCPKEVFPPADPLQFCTTGYGPGYDSRMALGFIKESSTGAVKIGFAAMAIPLSRGEIDYAEGQATGMGMTPVDKEVIPPPTPDYTPFATKLSGAGPDWVFSWAPWVTQVKTFESLRRLGWSGRYIAYSHLEAEGELPRLKDASFYVFGANALSQDNLPVQAEIRDAAQKASVAYPAWQLSEGWIAGLALEAGLKKAGWPATPAALAAALGNLEVDTKGLRGGPIVWTGDNHFRTRQYYRVYRWDGDKQAVVRVKDWTGFDVK
jgi:branched-chain amino acid transport system substrate-binding protein